MPKYNIYKIRKDKEEELTEKLTSTYVGLKNTHSKKIDGYLFRFYFSSKPVPISVWWINLYKDFIDSDEIITNTVYFGVLLISNKNICYAVSFGKSHFYLREYCDTEFGLNLAERIADGNNIKIKTSKIHKSQKNKSIDTFLDNNNLDIDGGASIHYLKTRTNNKKKWGKTCSFGSSVQFSLAITPLDLASFINEIEEELKKPEIIDIPRTKEIKDDDEIKELDRKLFSALKNGNSGVQSDEFTMYGVNFVFVGECEYSFSLKNNSDAKLNNYNSELDLQRLRYFWKTHRTDDPVNETRVKIKNEYSKPFSKPLKHFLDYTDENRHCLINGKWHQFNTPYIKILEKEIDNIEFLYEEKYDFDYKKFNDLFDNEIKSGTTYKEKQFNIQRENDGFVNCDRIIETLRNKYKIEYLDLFKDDTLFFVKFGSPQKISYVIDQSNATLKIIQNNEGKIEINKNLIKPKKICLWILFERKTKVKKMSNIRSLIFAMKLADWKRNVLKAGYIPCIKINYVKNKEKKSKKK